MSINEIQQMFESKGIPYPISQEQAKSTMRDIYSLPGDNRFDYLDMVIRERFSLFERTQSQIEQQRERRGRFLKPFIVEYI